MLDTCISHAEIDEVHADSVTFGLEDWAING